MNWKEVLNKWSNGNYFKYPDTIKGRFQWNTSVLKDDAESRFKESFKTNKKLPEKQDFTSFKEHISQAKNKYVISFKNPNKDTVLVVPIPRPGKNYATLKDFCDNAPKIQQKIFWEEVSKLALKQMKTEKKVWISAHGLGVPYLHIRISNQPKYYFSQILSKE